MIGVKTARAMVIDNDPDEALPVLMALGRMGIGAVYLKGENQEELPKGALDGIRLLFLDMVLGTSTEVKEVISNLVAVMRQLLPTDPHPMLIVLWTNHFKDYGDAFKDALASEFKQLPSGVVVALEKTRFDLHDPAAIPLIAEAITEEISKRAPMNLVWHWEQSVHDAATRTTSALMELVMSGLEKPASDFVPVLWNILKAMVVAAGGEGDHEPREAASLLFETLNYLHIDRIETTLERIPEALAPAMKEVARVFKVVTSPEERARLNTMILTSRATDPSPRPGSVYLHRHWPKPADGQQSLFDQFPATAKNLVRELFDPSRDEGVKKSMAELMVVKGESAISGCKADIEKQKAEVVKRLVEMPMEDALLEFTPICDYAQGKQSMARLMRGFLMTDAQMEFLKQGPFLHAIGPIYIPDIDGPRHLVFNARYVSGCPVGAMKVQPSFRIRQQTMAAIQAWFASHAARPGYLFIDR